MHVFCLSHTESPDSVRQFRHCLQVGIYSQSSYVLKIPHTDRYIACADRWLPYPGVELFSGRVIRNYERRFRDYVPDQSPRTAGVSGRLVRHFENTKYARYVWLPIVWEGEKPVIRWTKEWML